MVTDDLFLEIMWEDGKSPDDDGELLSIIEELDQQHFDTFQHGIEESLPYVTFLQAELLFQSLKETYGNMQLKKVAICHLEGKEAVSEGEVFASPFVIDQNYQNLLLPLIQSILTDSEFGTYTYNEKREYFVNQIYPAYKISLNVPESSLPLFPVEGEQLIRTTPDIAKKVSQPVLSKGQSNPKTQSLTGVYILLGIVSLITIASLGLAIITLGQLSEKTTQVNYLYQEVKTLKKLSSTENEVDVFSRYFISTYYSGSKQELAEYLSDGDAKYTVPQTGNVQSVILEKITYSSDTKEYLVSYVLSVLKEKEPTQIRLNFTVVADQSSDHGFVITTEPKETNYLSTKK